MVRELIEKVCEERRNYIRLIRSELTLELLKIIRELYGDDIEIEVALKLILVELEMQEDRPNERLSKLLKISEISEKVMELMALEGKREYEEDECDCGECFELNFDDDCDCDDSDDWYDCDCDECCCDCEESGDDDSYLEFLLRK